VLAGAAALSISAAGGPAFGQTRCAQPGSITGNEAEGRRYHEAGVSAADAGDWAKAHAAFLDACRRMHHPFILANLGQAELELGMYREAAKHFSQHLRENPIEDEKTPQVKEMLKQAQAKIGTLTFRAAQGAEVFVDGSLVGRAPLPEALFVEPGLREVVAKPLGGPPVRVVRFIAAGASVELDLTPAVQAGDPSGLRKPGQTGPGAGGALPAPVLPENEESWARRPLIITGIVGLAGAAITAGIGTGYYIAHKNETEASTSFEGNTAVPRLFDKADNLETAEDCFRIGVPVLGGIGVVALVSGFLLSSPQKTSSETRVGAIVEPGRTGISVSGRW
jgi:tetratricopeptide (TPR) repeat protein